MATIEVVNHKRNSNHRTKSKTTKNIFICVCHICDLNGHNMTNCPKFVEMQKLFHGKCMVVVVEVQLVAETQKITIDVNVVDVNVTTRSKVIEEQVFKDRELRKAKSVIDQEKEWLKKSVVKIIQQIQKTQTQIEGPSTSMEGWNTTQPGMPNISLVETKKSLEVMNSQDKLKLVEKIFLDIGKEMLQTSCILSLGQLLKITPELKRYFYQKLKLKKTQNLGRATTKKQVGSLVPEVGTTTVVIDNHIAVIQVQIGKNIIEEVLLDGSSRINIITDS